MHASSLTIGTVLLALAATVPSHGAGNIRLAHLGELAAREANWAELFPEMPSSAETLVYMTAVLDDANPWSHDLEIVDAQSGALLGVGGFLLSGTTMAMPLQGQLAGGPGGTSFVSSHAFLVSGLIGGGGGADPRPVVGVQMTIELADLAFVAPVTVEVFVPLHFPASEFAADVLVLDASQALASAPVALEAALPDANPSSKLEAGAAMPGSSSPILSTAAKRIAFEGCKDAAWLGFADSVEGAWFNSALGAGTGDDGDEGSCIVGCMLAQGNAGDAVARMKLCLPGCGLTFLASGEGLLTWAWSAHTIAEEACVPSGKAAALR